MAKWWRKQSSGVKGAIVAGCFGIVVAIIGVVGTVLAPVIEKIVNNPTPQMPTLSIRYTTFGGERFLVARDLLNQSDQYDVVTNSCLQITYGESTIKTSFSRNQWSGYIATLIVTDLPIIIERLELEIVDFRPLDPSSVYETELRDPGTIGGAIGGYVTTTNTSQAIVPAKKGRFNLLTNRSYELPANGAVTFITSVILSEPGAYTFRVLPFLNSYSHGSRATPIPTDSVIRWVLLPGIKPTDVVDSFSGSLNLQECSR